MRGERGESVGWFVRCGRVRWAGALYSFAFRAFSVGFFGRFRWFPASGAWDGSLAGVTREPPAMDAFACPVGYTARPGGAGRHASRPATVSLEWCGEGGPRDVHAAFFRFLLSPTPGCDVPWGREDRSQSAKYCCRRAISYLLPWKAVLSFYFFELSCSTKSEACRRCDASVYLKKEGF